MSETANSLADLETLGADVQAPAQIAAVVREQEIDAQGRAYATGRRKDAV
ncbi:MAG: 30S ribosomal protein S9, partial [Sphingorhabdus sp.]